MFKEYLKKFAKWIVFPLALFFLAIMLAGVYSFNSEINPYILSINHPEKNIKNIGGVIKGKFTAQENNLADITIKFDNKKPLRGDSVFRIKNVLDKDWYYEATLAASQYYITPHYMFIIPTLIVNSKNQTYQLEVQLLSNISGGNNLTLDGKYPLASHYQYTEKAFIKEPGIMIEFILKKMLFYTSEKSFWHVFGVYSTPLILYLFYITFVRKLHSFEFVAKSRKKLSFILNPYMFLTFLCIGATIFIVPKSLDPMNVLFIFLWILGVIAYRLESRHSFGVALVLLSFYPFILYENMDWIAERLGIWTYMFLVVGTIHTIIEIKTDKSTRIDHFLSKLNLFTTHIATVLVGHFDSFIHSCIKNVLRFALFSFRNFLTIIILLIITTALFISGFNLYLEAMSYRDRQLKNPSVQLIEPTLVYPGTKVILYGNSFGDNSNKKNVLMCDGEQVRTDYWEDHKIIFTVPLNWKKPGMMDFWIEKPVEWEGKTTIEKTKVMQIKLLKAAEYFTPDDNLYFEQIKTWRKETREINGYN